jgi:hypothetical protein
LSISRGRSPVYSLDLRFRGSCSRSWSGGQRTVCVLNGNRNPYCPAPSQSDRHSNSSKGSNMQSTHAVVTFTPRRRNKGHFKWLLCLIVFSILMSAGPRL